MKTLLVKDTWISIGKGAGLAAAGAAATYLIAYMSGLDWGPWAPAAAAVLSVAANAVRKFGLQG
jgi:hypothetical protein